MKNKSLILFLILAIISCKKEETPPTTTPLPLSKNQVIHDEFEGIPIVLIGNASLNFIVSFESTLADGTTLTFSGLNTKLPTIMEDQEGNQWDISGLALEGPRKGEQLKAIPSYMGYWFAWGSVYPGIAIHDGAAPADNIPDLIPSEEWTIPTEHVFAGTGADGIPSLENPAFIQYRGRDYLDEEFYVKDDDLVIGIQVNGQYRLYPHAILNWHEVVNDEFDGMSYTLSFCPLTGTAIAWNRTINNELTTFGVSGLLYNNNLITYDRKTESFWSQMQGKCIHGPLIKQRLESIPILETTWSNWKIMIGEPTILSTNTGYNRTYTSSPYGNYPTNHQYIPFPLAYEDERLERKERVYGININNQVKVYRFSSFE